MTDPVSGPASTRDDGDRDRSAAVPPPTTVEELVRTQLIASLGGPRGILEAAVPTIAFTLTWLATHELRPTLIVSLGLAAVLVAVRLARRENVQYVVNSLVGITIAAVLVSRSGRAEDAFLPGIVWQAGTAVLMVASVLARWPFVGFLIGSVTGDPVAWRADPGVVRLCSRLTLLLALPSVLRVLVQYPLWRSGHVGWLGTARIVMGWPLQVGAIAVVLAVLARGETPLAPARTTGPAPD